MSIKTTCLAASLITLCACSTPDGSNELAGSASARECRPVPTASGSRMNRSICMTKAEWEVADAQTKAREDSQSEFFRRVGENTTQGQAPAFDSPSGL